MTTMAHVRPLRQISRELVRELGLHHNQLDSLSISQCHSLMALERFGVMTVADLAQLMRLEKSTMSRTVASLEKLKLITTLPDVADKRRKPVILSEEGRLRTAKIHQMADGQVNAALELMSPAEQETVLEGFRLYVRALIRSRKQQEFHIREVQPEDNPMLAHIIRATLTEYYANRPGYAFTDPEVDCIYETYQPANAVYYVITRNGKVMGGGGLGPLREAEGVCELQKMYFVKEARGMGLGHKILLLCLEAAERFGYRGCYLETLTRMHQAQRLYRRHGFSPLDEPMGNTGHSACNSFFYKDLAVNTSAALPNTGS